MPKVAIATMTTGANYGNALQNYAVLKLVERCGYTAETLNITTKNGYPDAIPNSNTIEDKLHPSYMRSWYQSRLLGQCGAKNDSDFRLNSLRGLKANTSLWHEAKEKKESVFRTFKKDVLKYTDFEVSNLDFNLENLKKYSAFITGSDQVWNPYYRTNSMVEFLQMAPKERRIAFAPSFGISEIPECRREEYARWLSEMPYLSVRETEGARIIKELTGRDAIVLLDPTFGLSKDEWLDFAQRPSNCDLLEDSYLFCYFLGNRDKDYTKYIKQYAEQHNCRVIDVNDVSQLEHYAYSPQEFVWLLANARAVFTDSFHGCAFSINMEKPFVVFDRVGDGCITQSSRITTILNRTNLMDRLNLMSVDKVNDISFEHSSRVINEEREKMISYLNNSLDSATSSTPSIHLATKRHCTGCAACYNACNHNAIEMKPDEEGFLYPVINQSKCVECHKCEMSCPADRYQPLSKETSAYYAISKERDVQLQSSSGGVFTEIAKYVISNNGVVYGAGFDESFNVCHMSAENQHELDKLRTSKYVQSDMGNTYIQVKEQLQDGRLVLFSGTPCQIAGLKSFLSKEYENLLLIDIICHGVPSPKIWQDYLEQEHSNNKIQSISFRNKDIGWNDFSMKVEYEDGTFYRELAVKDSFERAFLSNLTLRPSCYQCQYKTVERVSDITIADYWGVEIIHPELKEQEGVSLVLTHNDRGEEILKSSHGISYGETSLEKATGMNSACTHSVAWPSKRNEFFVLESQQGVKKATDECLRLSKTQKAKKFVVRNGSRVKRVMRKVGVIK